MQNRDPQRPGETKQQWLDRTDPGFHQDRRDSDRYVDLTVRLLRDLGHFVIKPGMYDRPDGGISDKHDIWAGKVVSCVGGEVKSRVGWNFRNLPDFTTRGGKYNLGTYATIILDTFHHVDDLLNHLRSMPKFYHQWSGDGSGLIEIDAESTFNRDLNGIPIWCLQWHRSTRAGCDKVHIMIPIYEWMGKPVMLSRELKRIFTLNRQQIETNLKPIKGLRYMSREMIEAEKDRHGRRISKMRERLRGLKWMESGIDGNGKYFESYPLDKVEDPAKKKEEKPLEEEVARLF